MGPPLRCGHSFTPRSLLLSHLLDDCLLTSDLQYEIRTNPEVVDLLVSLAHVAASEGALEEPLPVGMGLRVPVPKVSASTPAQHPVYHVGVHGTAAPPPLEPPRACVVGPDGLCEFDELALVQVGCISYIVFMSYVLAHTCLVSVHSQMRASIAELINTLPSVCCFFNCG